MIRGIRILFIFSSLFGLISCHHKNEVVVNPSLTREQVTEKLLAANKATIEFENSQIDKMIDSLHWDMQKTSTGLRYQILETGNGPKVTTGKIARFEYEVKLFSGEMVYTSVKTGPKEFKIGSGGVESGLEEAMLLLRTGDKARLIIPSYLAHGLSGDQDKIPPKATLFYTLKLIDLK